MSDYRTWGETKNCKGCRYWSEMLAQSIGNGMEAVCLDPSKGPAKAMKYVPAWHSCDNWKSGHHGAVDEPCEEGYGVAVMRLYDDEDARSALSKAKGETT